MAGDSRLASRGDEEGVEGFERNSVHRALALEEADAEEGVLAGFDDGAVLIFFPADEVLAFAKDGALGFLLLTGGSVEDFQRFIDVEGPGFAIHHPAVIIEAVGDVAGFLDLDQGDAFADRVDGAGGDEEGVAFFDLNKVEKVHDAVIRQSEEDFVFGGFPAESDIEPSARFGGDDMPHLGLAEVMLDLLRIIVVGMNLNREVGFRVD